MKKTILFLCSVYALCTGMTAQAQNAHEASVKFNKTNQNAVVADYSQPAEVVEAALKDRLEKEGLGKLKTAKGFLACNGVQWSTVSSDKIDVYFKVEGGKDKSSIQVLVSKGYDNFISSGSDSKTIDNVKGFLNSFMKHASAYQLSLNIKEQEEVTRKAEKAYAGTLESSKELLAQKEKLEKKIIENNNEQLLKQTALNAERQKLAELKTKSN
jgi:hypothetical protein